jgi:hypothetical protein
MRVRRVFKLFYQLMTDREVYFLLGLAIRNVFRKKIPTRSIPPVKKRSKAMTAK